MSSGAAFEEGDIVGGRYRVAHFLGRGGMGTVYAAEHLALGERVALKVLHPHVATDPTTVARFVNEARAAFRVQGEHVVRVLDVGEHDRRPFMVMEFLAGEDLARFLARSGPLPIDVTLDYVQQAIAGVAQAHAVGIVHRDLKPANLFLTHRSDGTTVVKVLDFGISKLDPAMAGESARLTTTRSMLGSPAYMSPEQLRSARDTDARSDIWALGVILHELLTGCLPFPAETIGELFAAILEQAPAPVSTYRPDVPPWLDEAVRRCLQRRPEARFQSVQALSKALRGTGSTSPIETYSDAAAPTPARSSSAYAAPALPPTVDRSTSHASVWTPVGLDHEPALPANAAEAVRRTSDAGATLLDGRQKIVLVGAAMGLALVIGIGGAYALLSMSDRAQPSTSESSSELPVDDPTSSTPPPTTAAAPAPTELARAGEAGPSDVRPSQTIAEPSVVSSTSTPRRRQDGAPPTSTSVRRPPAPVAPAASSANSLPAPPASEYNPWQAGRKGT